MSVVVRPKICVFGSFVFACRPRGHTSVDDGSKYSPARAFALREYGIHALSSLAASSRFRPYDVGVFGERTFGGRCGLKARVPVCVLWSCSSRAKSRSDQRSASATGPVYIMHTGCVCSVQKLPSLRSPLFVCVMSINSNLKSRH